MEDSGEAIARHAAQSLMFLHNFGHYGGTLKNPNNCAGCRFQADMPHDGGHCYMFKTEPIPCPQCQKAAEPAPRDAPVYADTDEARARRG